MTHKVYITKDRAGIDVGKRQMVDMKFRQATEDDIKKALEPGTSLDDLPEGYIAGWASTSNKDHAFHVVAPGAFEEAIAEKGLDGPKGIKLLAQHRSDRPAGKIHKLEYRGGDLWIEAQLNLNISYVRDLYEAAKMQGGLSFSVGFFLENYEFRGEDGEEYLYISKGELFEVSVVTFPCNDDAQMTYIKGITDVEAFGSLAEFEKALVASGLVDSRNAAARVTQVVKRNPQLFAAAPAEPPAEDALELDGLQKSLDDLNKLFAN